MSCREVPRIMMFTVRHIEIVTISQRDVPNFCKAPRLDSTGMQHASTPIKTQQE